MWCVLSDFLLLVLGVIIGITFMFSLVEEKDTDENMEKTEWRNENEFRSKSV